MELRQLKTFRTVAETLGFTKTAEQLYMAQSSVSAQIKGLEDDLEVKLFDRIGRRVLLTDAGRKLYDYARRIDEMTLEIRSEMSESTSMRGNLTIRVPETLASIYMPEIVNLYHKQNPKVKLNFINCTDRQLREELNSGRIDLAFLMTDAIHFNDVNVKFLKTEKLQLIASPVHPLAEKNKVRLEDLHDELVFLPKTD
jgi:DNA-binding transcriptional LysR family regulator